MSLSATQIYRLVSSRHPLPDLLTLGFDEEISLGDHILTKLLHGIVRFSSIPLDHVDLTEGASTDDFYELEVAEANLFVWSEQVFALVRLIVHLLQV